MYRYDLDSSYTVEDCKTEIEDKASVKAWLYPSSYYLVFNGKALEVGLCTLTPPDP